MSELTSLQKKEWAKLLYTKERLPQKEIAGRIGVSPVTVNRWVKKERWDDLRVSLSITREEQLKSLYNQLKEINDAIATRYERRYATTQESDIIAKLSAAIEKMETDTGLAQIIPSFKGFFEWLRQVDLQRAQELIPLFDNYVKTKLS